MIYLINGSFEGIPNCCMTPAGWLDCGFKTETPPDIQPASPGSQALFGVVKQPINGKTYLGMVARQNETYERVSQHLSSPMLKGKCYSFSIYLTRSPIYLSSTKDDTFRRTKPFITPLILKIYGGDGYCHQKQLLAESQPVSDTIWKKYDFTFSPNSDMSYLELCVFYKTPVLFPYNGNMLLDNASSLKLIPCPNENNTSNQPKTTPRKTVQSTATKKQIQNTSQPTTTQDPKENSRIMKDLTLEKMKLGTVIKIEKLYFDADSSNFKAESYPALNEIFDFLNGNPKIHIEVGGHTNGQPSHDFCDRLSSARAKSIKDYLVSKGIAENRIIYRGYGKRQPIASNDTKEGRNKNQRVEIKIISI